MQSALIYPDSESRLFHLGLPALFFLAIGFALPIRVGNFDFRHFSESEGMTLSFSRNSPPLAALEDEHLPLVKTEPLQEMKMVPHSKVIEAGTDLAWKRLQKYAYYFEKKHYGSSKAPLSKPPVHVLAGGFLGHKKTIKLTKISDLTKLLAPVNIRSLPGLTVLMTTRPKLEDGGGYQLNPLTSIKALEAVHQAERRNPQKQPLNSTFEIDNSERSELSRTPSHEELMTGGGGSPILVERGTIPPKGSWQMHRLPPPVSQNQNSSKQASGVGSQSVVIAKVTTPLANVRRTQPIVENNQPPETQEVNARIMGQVELTGGLAVTGQSTQLSIQWKASGKSIDAVVDYSTGQFVVDVPTLDAGKLIARLTDDSHRVLGEAFYDLDGASTPGQTLLEGVKLIVEPKETSTRGKVLSAYSVGNIVVPVEDVEVFGPAGTRESADSAGNFKLAGLNSDSTFVIEAYAPNHWGTRVISEGNRKTQFPIFPVKMLQSFFDLVDQSANNTEMGVIWGEVKQKGKSKAGVKVTLGSTDAIGPFYFNALRIPDKKLEATTENGLYAFVKVRPGLHLLMARYDNRELPSAVVAVSASMVSYAEIALKSLTLKGAVQDPIEQKNLQAQVTVVGSSQTGLASQNGFNFRIPSSDPVLFVDANAGPDYYVSREAIPRSATGNFNLFAFKKVWVSEEMKAGNLNQDNSLGILVGYVTGPGFHVTVDPEMGHGLAYSDQNIGYFGKDGHIEGGRIEGLTAGGGFMLTNLPPGLHTLVITSSEGEMVSSRLFVSEPGVLNVMNILLRP